MQDNMVSYKVLEQVFAQLTPETLFRLFVTTCQMGEINIAEACLKVCPDILQRQGSVDGLRRGTVLCHLAASSIIPEMLDWMLEKGMNLNEKDPSGLTALELACKYNRLENVKLLLQRGALLRELAEENEQAGELYYAVVAKNLEMVKVLLQYGASTRSCLQERYNPFYQAIYDESLEIVAVFLKKGISPNSKHMKSSLAFEQLTPLHYAVLTRNKLLVKMLLVYGADPQEKIQSRCIAQNLCVKVNVLDLAIANGDEAIQEMLTMVGAQSSGEQLLQLVAAQ